jgi:hypothetical protein
MANQHGARQQKRAAKQKAKRSAKRAVLIQRTSTDPTIRLRAASRWPVIEAVASSAIWQDGIGYLCLARENPQGELAIGVFLVDVYCLGVKDTFWQIGTRTKLNQLIERLGSMRAMSPIAPACLAKIVRGSVDYAHSFGFPPHPDYAHTALILEGIDAANCPQHFVFGRDGKPFYIQGPNESTVTAMAIADALQRVGGHFMVGTTMDEFEVLAESDADPNNLDSLEDNEVLDSEPRKTLQ